MTLKMALDSASKMTLRLSRRPLKRQTFEDDAIGQNDDMMQFIGRETTFCTAEGHTFFSCIQAITTHVYVWPIKALESV